MVFYDNVRLALAQPQGLGTLFVLPPLYLGLDGEA